MIFPQTARKLLTLPLLVFWAAQVGAQDRMPTVPGALLLHSSDVSACLAPRDGVAPINRVFDALTNDIPGLRAIAFSWADIAASIEGAADKTLPFTESVRAEASPTVRSHPDGTVLSELAACQPDQVVTPPPVAFTGARAWLVPVSSDASDGVLAVPDTLNAYLSDVEAQAGLDGHLAICLLMGGVLDRQPFYANTLAAPIRAQIDAAVEPLGIANSFEARVTGALMNPNGMRLRGWDALLLADFLDEPRQQSACATLTARIFGEDAPSLGPDPLAMVDSCPAGGLGLGQSLTMRVPFEAGATGVDEAVEAQIVQAFECARRADTKLLATVEAYASISGGALENLQISNDRAQAIRQAVERLGLLTDEDHAQATGFGRTQRFGAKLEFNRVAVLTVTPVADASATTNTPGLAMAAARSFLDHPQGTCRPVDAEPVMRARSLLTFLDSDFGRAMMAQLAVPDMVVLLHNQTGQDQLQPALAKALQTAATGYGACGAKGKPHVGFLYQRSGPPYASGKPIDGPDRQDYFVLPPKITWIYPTAGGGGTPELSRFAEVVQQFDLTSENGVDLLALSDPRNTRLRRAWLNLVDVLKVNAPVPMTEVLQALEEADAGTGWVNLVSGWD